MSLEPSAKETEPEVVAMTQLFSLILNRRGLLKDRPPLEASRPEVQRAAKRAGSLLPVERTIAAAAFGCRAVRPRGRPSGDIDGGDIVGSIR